MKSKVFSWGFFIWVVLLFGFPVLAIEPETVEGKLDSTSETLSDGSFYDAYSFEGIAGESVLIELSMF